MTCERVSLPGGITAIVCSSRKKPRCKCGRPAPLLCDWKMPGKKSGTCDVPICKRCATSPAPDKDLCPAHSDALQSWKAKQRFVVFSEETGEWALPERGGWTSDPELAGHYTEDRADKAAETMMDGQRNCISLVRVRQ